MCKYCEYGRYKSDDRPCCEECYSNRQSQMVFYMDLYRKCDFLCKGFSFITIREGKKCLV